MDECCFLLKLYRSYQIAQSITNALFRGLFKIQLNIEDEDVYLFYIFLQTESLSYDEFYKWLTQNHEFSTVTRWLLEEQMSEHRIRISSNDNTPSFYSSLAKLTKCEFFMFDAIFLKLSIYISFWDLFSSFFSVKTL